MKRTIPKIIVVSSLLLTLTLPSPVDAAGKIKGSAGGHEKGAIAWSEEGELVGWTVTGPSGLYEFGGLAPGEYLMYMSGRIIPGVRVEDGRTTIVDQASQPKFELEKELWTPARVSFAQSFVAKGTAVTGFSLWRASGNSKLKVSLYENDLSGAPVAGPIETEKEITWISGSGLPADEFATTPGKTYVLRLEASDGKPWNHGAPRRGDVYAAGIAYYDDVPHPEADLGITIDQRIPDLVSVAGAGNDLHYIAEGPGSGTCTVAGQTFVATLDNLVRVHANCGWNGGIEEFIFSIHEDGPGGKQVGRPRVSKMVPNWGTDAIWGPGQMPLTPGKTYCLQYRRADGEPFFSYLSSNAYPEGRAYRDGKLLDEQFDQLFRIRGEVESGGLIYPYNVRAADITSTSARITWRTGVPGDGLVQFGRTGHMNEQAGSEQTRNTEHSVSLTNLQPGTVYRYRVSSDTHKKGARRIFSRTYEFMTRPSGPDQPRFTEPLPMPPWATCDDCLPVVNGGFERRTEGWTRIAQMGRAKEPETYVPDAEPFGNAGEGVDGYVPVEGRKHYGWSYFGFEDPTWKEPREDWKRELITQSIAVKVGQRYALTVWILTGDRGSGWGRDSRIRLAVDEEGAGKLDAFETADQANVTQWFATRHDWMPVTLEFEAKAPEVTIGAEFLNWWGLRANHLYIDNVSVKPIPGGK